MLADRVDSVVLERGRVDYQPPLLDLGHLELRRTGVPISLLGENAAGKSSFALVLAGAVPDAYWAAVELDLRVQMQTRTVSYPATRRVVQIVPQRWEHSTLGFDLGDELNLAGLHKNTWASRVVNKLELCRLKHCEPAQLSSGERKRLMIATGLMASPPLLVSDEWPAHLDAKWLATCDTLIGEYCELGGFHIELLSQAMQNLSRSYQSFPGNHIVASDGKIRRPRLASVLRTFLGQSSLDVQKEGWIRGNFRYSYRHGKRITVDASGGELVEVIGPNGSGKSTLLLEICKSSKGVRGVLSTIGRKRKTGGHVQLVQADPMFQILGPTVSDELGTVAEAKAFETAVGDDGHVQLQRDVLTLSTGERKLLALAAAAYGPSPSIALDEPVSGLDADAQELAREFIRSAVEAGKTVIVASQSSLFSEATKCVELRLECEPT